METILSEMRDLLKDPPGKLFIFPDSTTYKNVQGERKMSLTKNKFTLGVIAAALCMVLSAAENLPAELKNTPKAQIKDISQYIYGKQKVTDPGSPTGKAVIFIPAKNAKNYGGIGMGVYDKKYYQEKKKVLAWSRYKAPDEKYHWYKIRRTGKDVRFSGTGPQPQIYLENWSIGAKVPVKYVGKFECYVYVKAQGPFYVKGSTKENKLFLARVILVPIK